MKTVSLTGLPTGETYLWEIGTEANPISGGLNLCDLEYMLADNQSPKMVNMWYDGRVLGKRPGQRVAAEGLPELLCAYRRGDELIAAAADGRLVAISWDGKAAQVRDLYSGMTGGSGTFFSFGGRVYYLNGAEYLCYDGESCEPVTPYVPNIIINRPPSGEGGDLTDNYNRLTGAFRNTFSGDGTSTVYHLTGTGLDSLPPEVRVGGERMTSGWVFSAAEGTVTFSEAPPNGTNNVEITASKNDAEAQEMRRNLLACRAAAVFGGGNGTRVFLAGNGTSCYFYSDVTMPDYFPENNYNVAGDNTPITALAEQYGVLIVFKENEVWQISYSFDGDRASFPLKAVNRTVGCDAPGSIQLINNCLVWLHSKRGVFILLSTNVQDERNVQKISRNIEGTEERPGLMALSGLSGAASADWRGKYWLSAGGECWVWDYEAAPYVQSANPDLSAKALAWFRMTGIAAEQFLDLAGTGAAEESLGFGYRKGGEIIAFDGSYRDFGEGYTALWRMPVRSFNLMNRLKTVIEMWVTVRTDTNTRMEIRYITENTRAGEADERITASSFSFRGFAWDTFTWKVQAFAQTFRRKPKKKKIRYFALEFECGEPGRDMNISGVALSWRAAKKVKQQ